MEFLNSTTFINSHIFPSLPFFSNKLPMIYRKNANNSARFIIHSPRKLYFGRPFSLNLTHSRASNEFRIKAHFRRPERRQNYLRKKLTEYQQQRQVSPLQDPFHEFDKNDGLTVDSSRDRDKNLEERSSLNNLYSGSGDINEPETESVKKHLGDSIMWNKLESWVEKYKKDSEFWGIGTGPIFTAYQDSEGKVERVVVNADEIMRRGGIDPRLRASRKDEDLGEVNFKISFAKDLAKEMEGGSNRMMNSSVVKSVSGDRKSKFMESIRGVKLEPRSLPRMSRAGISVLCGLFVVWAMKGLFVVGEDREKHTRFEKEMLRRKLKSRREKENLVRGSVEVIQDPTELKSVPFMRPQLDKGELLNSITESRGSNNELITGSKDFEDKIKEIRAMARHAREIEKRDPLLDTDDREDDQAVDALSNEIMTPGNNLSQGDSTDIEESDLAKESNGTESLIADVISVFNALNLKEENQLTNNSGCFSDQPIGNSSRTKLRVIKSIKEAREYLSRKDRDLAVNQETKVRNDEQFDSALTMPSANTSSCKMDHALDLTVEGYDTSLSRERHDSSTHEKCNRGTDTLGGNADSLDDLSESRMLSSHEVTFSNQISEMSNNSMPGEKEMDLKISPKLDCKNERSPVLDNMDDSTTANVSVEELLTPLEKLNVEGTEENGTVSGLQMPGTTSGNEEDGRSQELESSKNKENWIQKNFHEFEPLVKRIGVGFRDNYVSAREKSNHELDSKTDISRLASDGDGHELEWMKDESLREIVFKVRDNELSGRDPFHLMDDEEKHTFFSGLEKKVEQENQKLLKLHEYFHENIENLDYGADGISLYDPPEKIIPRWKVPPAEKDPEFVSNFVEQRKAFLSESLENSFLIKKNGKDALHKLGEPSSHDNNPAEAEVTNQNTRFREEPAVCSKTIIAGSDGSVRAGKKSGREYWQHTKKRSQGFLESYNAETDPEVKAAMADVGKDLDRWITEKEIKEAADFLEKLPEKRQKLVKEKLEKVKREMELFGPQAVVSKYREYAEENEEDYLWWLDLPCVLCIELYTIDGGEQKVGLYSLEMAADLELDPKQHHVIAFEDVRDCNNFCYIIQAHLEMLGKGSAFVVARPPKGAFREAKSNGFSLTVIRKGQLQLNVDQTLEEVDELIVEIGSKMYHDKIMQAQSVDMKGLVKGVFGISKPSKKKRSKRKLKRRVKP